MTKIGERLFKFRFHTQLERAKFFLQQPRYFNKALLVMAAFRSIKNIDNSSFKRCLFLVQLHGVHAGLRLEKIVVYWGSKLRRFLAWIQRIKVRNGAVG